MTADVIDLNAKIRLDLDWVFGRLESCGGDAAKLWPEAMGACIGAHNCRSGPASAKNARKLMNYVALVFFATGEILGLPREAAMDLINPRSDTVPPPAA